MSKAEPVSAMAWWHKCSVCGDLDHQCDEIEVAKGRLEESGTHFRILVNERVTPDDLRAIANLMHMAATKLEAEHSAQRT